MRTHRNQTVRCIVSYRDNLITGKPFLGNGRDLFHAELPDLNCLFLEILIGFVAHGGNETVLVDGTNTVVCRDLVLYRM